MAEAATLFREKGYAGTTTRELSRLLGLQNASLYHHISGKEDLLYRLCIAALEDVKTAFDEVLDRHLSPSEQLEALAQTYTELALGDQDRHAAMLAEIRSLSPDRRAIVIDIRDQNVAVVRNTIVAAQENGELRQDIEAKYLALALFNLLNWSIFWWHPGGDLTALELAGFLWKIYAEGAAAER